MLLVVAVLLAGCGRNAPAVPHSPDVVTTSAGPVRGVLGGGPDGGFRLFQGIPYAAAPVRSEGEPVFTKAEVASEAEQRRLKRREYQRAWYAKQRTKSKQREYSAAYRARKKAEAAAALAIGGTE